MIRTHLCPVCHESLLPQGMRNHILGRARQEVYQLYLATKAGMSFKVPHQKYIEKNVSITSSKKIKLKYQFK